jgi:shikimate kinase
MNPAPNLVLVGPMGAGKTSIGRRLADRLGLEFVDVDRSIEDRTGARIATIFDCEGEDGFRARERTTLAALLAGTGMLAATSGGAVLDPGSRALIRMRGYAVWLQVAPDEQLRRLAKDRTRPLIASGDRAQVLRRLALQRDPLYAEVADLPFDTTGLSPANAARELADLLQARWQRGEAA